ncbi:MAG: DnaD domain protein [Clostridiales bacterium]|nr:DnaD domain protein [Clostridiales bacterium]
MKYSINPAVWGSAFTVPAQIVDEHIRLAGAAQIKALLWALRHIGEGIDLEKISAGIGLSGADTADALQYWVEHGILTVDGREPEVRVSAAAEQTAPKAPEKKILSDLPVIKPTNEQILARCKESAEIKDLFQEAQSKLGRTIGYDTQSILLMLCDQYGLPVDVIMMLLEYCTSVGKTSNSYISSVGKNWAEQEIDTIEKADEHIEKLKSCRRLWSRLAKEAGISAPNPTTSQSAFLYTWSHDFGYDFDMIYLAYEEMADHTGSLSFAYMNKVLSNWHANGFKTVDEALAAKAERAKTKESRKNGEPKKEASYNIDQYKREALEQPLVYRKNNG